MEKAKLNRPTKPLLMGFVNNNNNSIDPFLIHQSVQRYALIVLCLLLCLTTAQVYATPPVERQSEESKSQVQRNKRLNRAINNYKVDGSQFNNTQLKSYRRKGNRQIFKFEDGSKLVINTKKNKVKIVNKHVNIPSNSTKPNTIKIPRAKNKTKAVLKFDESGLIAYKIGNRKAKLNQPIPKNSVIKKIESKVDGTLKKIKIKQTPKQTKIVSVFKVKPKHKSRPISVDKPINDVSPQQPLPPANEMPNETELNPHLVMDEPIVDNNIEEKPSILMNEPANTPIESPVEKTVPPIVVETIPAEPINTPSNNAEIAEPVINTRNIQVPASDQVVSITQPIIGEPDTSIVSLNLGEPDNPLGNTNSFDQQSTAIPTPLFNARIADSAEEISEAEATNNQSMPINKIAYVDVNAISKKNTNMFGTIGTGIGMKLGQCEEMDGCAPSIDENHLEELEQKLHTELELLDKLEAKKSSSHLKRKKQALLFKMDAIQQHKEQLNLLKSQELENQVAMDDLSKPDPIPESKFPLRQSDYASPKSAVSYDMSQFDTSIFEDHQHEIADDL